MTRFTTLTPGSTEWDQAWEELRERQGTADGDPVTGEMWQYMGTHNEAGMGFVHDFRHRCHPVTRQRVYQRLFASFDFNGAMARGDYERAGVSGETGS